MFLTTEQVLEQFHGQVQSDREKMQNESKRAEWLMSRMGCFTASSIHKLFTKRYAIAKNETSRKYINMVAAQRLGAMPEEVSSASLRWGKDHEEQAVAYFIETTGLDVDFWGGHQVFVKHPEYNFIGATTDGIVQGEKVFEQKCPYNPAEHLANIKCKDQLELKINHTDYYIQIQIQMMCNGLEQGVFSSFDDRFPERLKQVVIEVEKDEELQEQLLARLIEANEEVEFILDSIEERLKKR